MDTIDLEAGDPNQGPTPAPFGTSPQDPGNAYLAALRQARSPELVGADGMSYKAFRASLVTPRYGEIYRDLAFGHACLWGTLLMLGLMQGVLGSWPWQLAAAIGGSVSIGFWLQFLYLFVHEAAHFGLAADRTTNDRIANWLVGLPLGIEIAAYRPIHMDHHRHLGDPLDTERTYFSPLGGQFICECLTGIRILKVLAVRRASKQRSDLAGGKGSPMFFGAMALHGVLVLSTAANGLWTLSLAWALGVVVVFTFLGALRQLLEHRGEHARADVDYGQVPHGAMARMFGTSGFDSLFGGAGFNRHLLHHMDPQVSYTRLPELDAFLRTTSLAPYLEGQTTTYFRAFLKLYGRP